MLGRAGLGLGQARLAKHVEEPAVIGILVAKAADEQERRRLGIVKQVCQQHCAVFVSPL